MTTATWNGTLIASSDDTVVVEGNHYFPRSSLAEGVSLDDSAKTSVCPWKGTASYASISVDGQVNTDAAWFYPEPKPAAAEIRDRLAFWKGVQVSS